MKADKPKQALEDQDAENVNTDEEAAKEEECAIGSKKIVLLKIVL